MIIRGKSVSGVVAELNGKYWGLQYEDGHSSQSGFGPIDKATIANPEFCTKPENMTYEKDPQGRELAKAVLKKVTKTTEFDFE